MTQEAAPLSSPHPQMSAFFSFSRYTTSNTIGAKFHMFDECFPNQFLHPSIRSITLSGTTQATPNGLNLNSTTSTSSYLHLKRRNIRLQDMKKSQHQLHFLVIKITMEPSIPAPPLPPCSLTNKDSTNASQLVAFSYKTRKASLTG